MGKSRRGSKEISREQKLSNENKQLKRELSHLRKQLSRIDLDRFETVRQLCDDFEESEKFQENLAETNPTLDELKRVWACKKCSKGFLEIVLYTKLSETCYYRKCVECANRTKGQRYSSESVKGILKNG